MTVVKDAKELLGLMTPSVKFITFLTILPLIGRSSHCLVNKINVAFQYHRNEITKLTTEQTRLD